MQNEAKEEEKHTHAHTHSLQVSLRVAQVHCPFDNNIKCAHTWELIYLLAECIK